MPQFIDLIKKTLAAGYTIPLGFPINIDRIEGDLFTGFNQGADFNSPLTFSRDGGHLVLITDFVNKGGREGAVSQDEQLAELARPAGELEYLVFKNSWGIGSVQTENGQELGNSVDGHFRMDYGYLFGSARVPELLGGMNSNALVIVVPNHLLSPTNKLEQ